MSRLQLQNVKEELRRVVSQDQVARELASSLDGLFSITNYKKFQAYNGRYTSMYAMPTKTISASLAVEREVIVLIANYNGLHARTVAVCKENIEREQPRLQPNVAIILHSDPEGDENLRAWGREAGMTIMPIYRPSAGAVPPTEQVRQRLARELFGMDSFEVTGPISDDNDFFGRREQAIDLVRQLQTGRIAALFGLRKVGKTSFLNRVIDIAKRSGTLDVAMVDCSIRGFSELKAQEALGALARLLRLANQQGYSHISQTLHRVDRDLMTNFENIWNSEKATKKTLLVIFDEVDFITPDSPVSRHWELEFNEFWREFRAVVQESRRQDFKLSIVVSGASSKSFRIAEIGGVENSALHFVPEDYLSPFELGAADAMLQTLARRCGLRFDKASRLHIAACAAYLPYWMRMVGSYIHRHIAVDNRPIDVAPSLVENLCEEFASTEGAEIAKVALQNFRRVDRPMFDLLTQCKSQGSASLRETRPLIRYGLLRQRGLEAVIDSRMVETGLELLLEETSIPSANKLYSATNGSLALSEIQWAEELASISGRRNLLERRSREFVRIVLRAALPGKEWINAVTTALPQSRREACAGVTPDILMNKLYWIDLWSIISREWKHFEKFLLDKRRAQNAFELLNERPDAHAKDVDLADIALQRRELTWLEEKILQ